MKTKIIKANKQSEKYIQSFGINILDHVYIINHDNCNVGIIEFIEYEEQIHVEYINIKEEHRRNGIAKSVIDILKGTGKEIYGDALFSSVDFWLSIEANFEDAEDNIEEYQENNSCIPFYIH